MVETYKHVRWNNCKRTYRSKTAGVKVLLIKLLLNSLKKSFKLLYNEIKQFNGRSY